jgi:hypothetical protein
MVIIIEDSLLHPGYPMLAWLMMVFGAKFRGDAAFIPSPSLIWAVLSIVEEVASSKVHDDARGRGLRLPGRRFADDIEIGSIRACLRSIYARSLYGGMRCDVEMLVESACTWHMRFNGTPAPPQVDRPHCSSESGRRPIALWYISSSYLAEFGASSWGSYLISEYYESWRQKGTPCLIGSQRLHSEGYLDQIRSSDAIMAGVDFHVWPEVSGPVLIEHLLRGGPADQEKGALLKSITDEKRRSAMWFCSSGLNTRKALSSGSSLSNGIDIEHWKVWALMAPPHHAVASRRLSSFRLPPG